MKILVNRKINRLFLCLLLIMVTATAIIFIALKLENIEAHNGTIEVDSTLGVGTTFTINFLIPTKL